MRPIHRGIGIYGSSFIFNHEDTSADHRQGFPCKTLQKCISNSSLNDLFRDLSLYNSCVSNIGGVLRMHRANFVLTSCMMLDKRGSRKFCQSKSNFDNVFFLKARGSKQILL